MKKLLTPRRITMLFLVLSLLLVGFIFSNSLKNGAESHRDSNGIIALIKPLLDPHDRIAHEDFSYMIRKLAHMVEFCALGICLAGAVHGLRAETGHSFSGWAAFTALAVAVCDEFIQRFTGRTSAVSDILIDFAGALIGFLIVQCFAALMTAPKNVTARIQLHKQKGKKKE